MEYSDMTVRGCSRSLFSSLRLLFFGCVLCLGSPVFGDLPAADSDVADTQLYEEALAYFNQGEYQAAIIQLKNQLLQEPGDLPSHILLGRAYLATGRPAEAENELLLALEQGGDRELIDIYLARILLQQRKFDELLSRFQPGTYRGQAAALYLVQAEAYLELGSFDEAYAAYENAAASGADDLLVRMGKIRIDLVRGRIDAAELALQDELQRSTDNSEAWYLKGKIEQARDNTRGAIDALSKAISLNPNHVPARLSRAELLIGLKRYDEAEVDLERVQKDYPFEPMAIYLQSIVYARRGETEEADAALQLVYRITSSMLTKDLTNHGTSLLLAGVVAFERNIYEEAALHLSRYLTRHPRHTGARKRLAHVLLSQGKPGQALKVIILARQDPPRDPQVLALLGQAYMDLGRYDEASAVLEQAVELAPDDSATKLGLARSQLSHRQYRQATASLESVFQVIEGKGRVGILLGLLYLRQGEVDAAIRTAKEMVSRAPSNLVAWNLLGAAYTAKGDFLSARQALDRALKMDASNLATQLNLARLDALAGHPDRARGRYREILDARPEQKNALHGLALLEESEGHNDQAIRLWQKLRSLYPDAVGEIGSLARLYLRTGQPRKAWAVARELEARRPDDIRSLDLLGRTQLAAGRSDLARSSFRKLALRFYSDPENLYRIANMQLLIDDREEAYKSLRAVVRKVPHYLPAQVSLSQLETRTGRLDDALARALEIQKAAPGQAAGYLLEGDVYLARGETAQAEQIYLKAWEIDPVSDVVVRLYGARQQSGTIADALGILEEWLEGHPQDLRVKKLLASALIASGQYSRAITLHEVLLVQLPNDATILNNLAMLYQDAADPRALAIAERAYALSPDNPNVGDTYGWLLVQEGRVDEGLNYLRQAGARAAGMHGVRYHIAVALQRQGQHAAAARELRSLLASDRVFPDREAAEALLRQLAGGLGK